LNSQGYQKNWMFSFIPEEVSLELGFLDRLVVVLRRIEEFLFLDEVGCLFSQKSLRHFLLLFQEIIAFSLYFPLN
jgi:hypothetical protein